MNVKIIFERATFDSALINQGQIVDAGVTIDGHHWHRGWVGLGISQSEDWHQVADLVRLAESELVKAERLAGVTAVMAVLAFDGRRWAVDIQETMTISYDHAAGGYGRAS